MRKIYSEAHPACLIIYPQIFKYFNKYLFVFELQRLSDRDLITMHRHSQVKSIDSWKRFQSKFKHKLIAFSKITHA